MYLVSPPSLLKKYYGPKVIWNIPSKDDNKLFLTFDDGPHPEVTPQVLAILKEYNAKATFFCVGENVLKYPKIYNDIMQNGHAVGNHTYNHLNGGKTKNEEYISNIKKCSECVSSQLFRPPYGVLTRSQINKLTNDYAIIMWDTLSGDYDKNTSPEKCFQNVVENAKSGSIVVFHDSLKAKTNMLFALSKTLKHFTDLGFYFMNITKNYEVFKHTPALNLV